MLNNVAWLLATHPDPNLRNGKLALEVAKRAAKITAYKDPSYLDTLAAAYAETGDFAKAIETATRALDLVDENRQPELHASLTKGLLLYRARKPMR
mgnify:CR=1 FL=1